MHYKLTTQEMTTAYNTQWEIGVKRTVKPGKMELCSNTVLHYYDSPVLAVLLNPIHAGTKNPRLFEIKTSKAFVADRLKFGCKSQTLTKEIPLPEITTNQKIAFAILCALEVYQESSFTEWANSWLFGKNRTADAYAAYAAAYAAYVADDAAYAAHAAAYAAAYAAYAAAADADADADDAAAAYAAYAAAYAAADADADAAADKIDFKAIAEKAMQYV